MPFRVILIVIYFQALQRLLHGAETQKHGLTTPTEHFFVDFTEFLTSSTVPGEAHTEDRGFKIQAGKSEAQMKSNHRKSNRRLLFCCLKDVQLLPPRI